MLVFWGYCMSPGPRFHQVSPKLAFGGDLVPNKLKCSELVRLAIEVTRFS